MHELLDIFKHVFMRDLRVYAARKSEWLSVALFFVIIVTLFTLAVDALATDVKVLIPGIVWVSALLATLLAQESLFRMDSQLGIFELFIMSPYPLSVMILAKSLATWLVVGLPIILITPIMALSFSLPPVAIKTLSLTLLLGTPTLCLLAILGNAITLSLHRGGLLLAVLILPLYIPVLILGAGAGAGSLSIQALPVLGHLALLLAIAIGTLFLAPLAIGAALRVSVL
jgi:heme exporter protein B